MSVFYIIIERYIQPIIKQDGIGTDVYLLGFLPTQLIVTRTLERNTRPTVIRGLGTHLTLGRVIAYPR